MKQPTAFSPGSQRQRHSLFLKPFKRFSTATAMLSSAMLLSACASWPGRVAPSEPAAPAKIAEVAPAQWQTPFPHEGQLTDLSRWWQQFDDPVLTQLIDAAQAVSPSVASSKSRIAQSQATRVAASAALLPSVNGNAAASHGRQDLLTPVGTSATVGVSSAWELDIFGANRAAGNAAQARLEGAQAAWHDARVSVAAEVANAYIGLRACEAQLAQLRFDATSRSETSRLTGLLADAGFQPPANAALARASAAQGNSNLSRQQGQCDLAIKSLVALTAIDEPSLRTRLAPVAGIAPIPQPPTLNIAAIPAESLAQRPDVYTAARELIAASADEFFSYFLG
ncbi:MAG: TolC family protein [Pseudomonadota bacterium]